MNDEIKEILEELKEKNETYKECSENGIIENEYYKSHILLDYITNLQESEAYYYGQYKDYKSRNEKAIEYLEQNPVIEINGEFRNIYSEDDDKLLKILKGDDKNE